MSTNPCFLVLVTSLDSLIKSISFIWDGIISHDFEPLYEKCSNSSLTVLALGLANYEKFLILSYRKSLC